MDAIDGRWHLIPADWQGDHLPEHRLDLVFHRELSGLRGAILSRVDEGELALQTIAFDGEELRIQMGGHSTESAHEPPFLVLKPVADHFEGGWDYPGMERIRMKLVRTPDR